MEDAPDTTAGPLTVVFRGVLYRLMGRRTYYLSQSTSNAGRRRAKGLHVAVWEAEHGQPVPKGHNVHHVDHNPLNNHPSNLQAITRAEHMRHHPVRDKAAHDKHLERVRPLTKGWHASAEGREVHRQAAKRGWQKAVERTHVCVWCGTETRSRAPSRRFCSAMCTFRTNRWLGKLDRTCRCRTCGKDFVTPPYAFSSYPLLCSKACGSRVTKGRGQPVAGSPLLTNVHGPQSPS